MFNETRFRAFLRDLSREALATQSRFWNSMYWAFSRSGYAPANMLMHELSQREHLCTREWISRGGYDAA